MEIDHHAPVLKVSVVVPTWNEAKNLPHVLGALPDGLHEVILVDGGSVDGTVSVARAVRPDIRVVHQTRRGKGNALACGFSVVTGDLVVTLDADGSADPAEIPIFVDVLSSGADFAKGTRFSRGGDSDDITRFRRFGNAGLNVLVNWLFGTRYTDLCYGYNAFWADMFDCFDLPDIHCPAGPDQRVWGDGFEIETLINVRAAAAGARITEVGSVEKLRLHGNSNLNTVRDGLRVLRTIVEERRRLSRTHPVPTLRRDERVSRRPVSAPALWPAAAGVTAGPVASGGGRRTARRPGLVPARAEVVDLEALETRTTDPGTTGRGVGAAT
jgi:glycosyltransferase involved in cell wall biosynthesis